ncbi:flagellar basal-body rod protein FlgB [Lentibacillus persicus]|uniref:Flagellar basal body rod protein FlgB n=1 Tax=Lentibacillus persicus TaxID=640948 RepID=A0A1I1VCK4_9BACI|nr:flagellar basal body rod protein FlgB [Lentibacillus persicus]SFD80762.1 flagellar basal-body rod protein FlgB [Lentibacillus persicus]
MEFFSGSFQTLENSLKYASAKNRTLSNNIANVDTPGYKAKDVKFKNYLSAELESSVNAVKTHPKHLPFNQSVSQPIHTVSRDNTTYNHNGNNVDIDKEMAELAKNQINYQALVDRINGKFSSLKTVIGGGN